MASKSGFNTRFQIQLQYKPNEENRSVTVTTFKCYSETANANDNEEDKDVVEEDGDDDEMWLGMMKGSRSMKGAPEEEEEVVPTLSVGRWIVVLNNDYF